MKKLVSLSWLEKLAMCKYVKVQEMLTTIQNINSNFNKNNIPSNLVYLGSKIFLFKEYWRLWKTVFQWKVLAKRGMRRISSSNVISMLVNTLKKILLSCSKIFVITVGANNYIYQATVHSFMCLLLENNKLYNMNKYLFNRKFYSSTRKFHFAFHEL